MKKLYLLLTICTISSILNAQNFSADVPDLTIFTPQESIFTFEGSIDLQNHTFGDLNMAFEQIEENVPNGWQTSNCLGANCLPIGVKTGTFTLPVLSPDNYVIGHFYPNNVAGSGSMKIKIYEVFNPSASIILTYYGVAGTVSGVQELKATDVQAFPNPASDFLTIMLPNDGGASLKIELLDALGRVVKSEITTQSTTQLDISNLSKGVYFVATGAVRKKIIKG